MENELKHDDRDTDDEISLVDLLAVLIRKRKLWLGITAGGIVLALGFLLLGRIAPRLVGIEPSWSSSIRAFVLDAGSGQAAAALVTSGACTELVAAATNETLGAVYARNATAAWDEKSRIITLTVKAPSENDAASLAKAGFAGLNTLLQGSGPDRYRLMSDYLEDQVEITASADKTIDAPPEMEGLVTIVALARSARIMTEVYISTMVKPKGFDDPALIAVSDLVEKYWQIEYSAMATLVRTGGGNSLSPQANLAVAEWTSRNLVGMSALFKSQPSEKDEVLRFLDQKTAVAKGSTLIGGKGSILIIFASLFLGILLAFVSSAWDGIKADPVAMEKLRSAVNAGGRRN
jgi:hypothetical protein